ncbi:MAG: GNAT family N-acetyltransferase [Myxococcota bacterium]
MADESESNEWGQPIGARVKDWRGAKRPSREVMRGERCRLEPLEASAHAAALHAAYAQEETRRNWTYLAYGPFETVESYAEWVRAGEGGDDPVFFAVVDGATNAAVGVAAFLRVFPEQGSIEVGHLSFSPLMQRKPIATEALYLMMRRVFEDWGYRRYEWKCHNLNAPSRAAAERLGFRFEGIFRNDQVSKGRNRDTAWFSITDAEWPGVKSALEEWLAPGNFDATGAQRARLAELMPETAGKPTL